MTTFPTGFPARYSFRRKLAEGGMGAVYVAFDGLLGREVAIKVIRSDRLGSDARSDRARARFSREAQVMARVKHAGCVPVYDAGFAGGQPFLVMDYVVGRSLSEAIAQRPDGGLEVERIVRWGRDLAEALQACHDVGVVHRDVKPANVLLDHNDLPHLTDFGVARDDEAHTKLTADSAPIGTLAYMAPEQAEGLPGVGFAADIYALGVTLYEALTGDVPFNAQGYVPLLAQILNESPPLLRGKRPDVPPDLAVVVSACLQKDPADRYPSAQELANDLACVLRGQPIARQTGPWARLRRRAWRRRRTLAGLLGGGLLVGLALLAWGSLRQRWRVEGESAALSEARAVYGSLLEGTGEVTSASLLVAERELRLLSAQGATPRLRSEAEGALRELAGVRLLGAARLAVSTYVDACALERAEGAEFRQIETGLTPTERSRAYRESPEKQRRGLLQQRQAANQARSELTFAQADRLLAQAEALLSKGATARLRAEFHAQRFRQLSVASPEVGEEHASLAVQAFRQRGLSPPADLSPARISLSSSPPAPWVLERYHYNPSTGVMTPDLVERGEGSLVLSLDPGEYRVTWRLLDHMSLALPFVASRGLALERRVVLTRSSVLGPFAGSFVALPGGQSPALRHDQLFQEVGPFLLGKFEVTLEAWVSWLVHVGSDLGKWGEWFRAGNSDWPACRFSTPQGLEYVDWIGSELALYGITGNVRLPSLHHMSWSVRGGLPWTYPWGRLYDDSFVGWTSDLGLVHLPVGSQPFDCSPFGVRDLAGSCSEMIESSDSSVGLCYGGTRTGGLSIVRDQLWGAALVQLEEVGLDLGLRIMIDPSQPSKHQLPEPNPQRASQLLAVAVQIHRQGNTWQAMRQVTEALRFDNSRWDLFLGRSQLRRELGDTYGAFLDATQATLLEPTAVQAWEELGIVQRVRGKWEAAEVAAVRALEIDPNALNGLAIRGAAREKLGDRAGAHDDYGRWLEAAPADPSPQRKTIQERWEATAR